MLFEVEEKSFLVPVGNFCSRVSIKRGSTGRCYAAEVCCKAMAIRWRSAYEKFVLRLK